MKGSTGDSIYKGLYKRFYRVPQRFLNGLYEGFLRNRTGVWRLGFRGLGFRCRGVGDSE